MTSFARIELSRIERSGVALSRFAHMVWICAFLASAAAVASPAYADPVIEAAAQGIFNRVMSPYCPGLLLAACPSPAAEELRNEIRARLKAGESADAIEQAMHAQFGGRTRAAPAFSGVGVVVWTIPIVLFLCGGAVYVAWLRRCRDVARDSTPPVSVNGDLEARLDDELSAL